MTQRQKKKGERVSFFIKGDSPDELVTWINKQSKLGESIRCLIEQDIALHGIRDLNEVIAQSRFAQYRSRYVTNLEDLAQK